jgi:hypothetical protein
MTSRSVAAARPRAGPVQVSVFDFSYAVIANELRDLTLGYSSHNIACVILPPIKRSFAVLRMTCG